MNPPHLRNRSLPLAPLSPPLVLPSDRRDAGGVQEEGEGMTLPRITYWVFVRSSWTMGCGNWGTRYERIDGPEA